MKNKKDGGFFSFLYHLILYGVIIFAVAAVAYPACLIVITLIDGEPITWQVIKNGLMKAFYHAILLDLFYVLLYFMAQAVEFWFFITDFIWRMKQKRKDRKEKVNADTHLYRSE